MSVLLAAAAISLAMAAAFGWVVWRLVLSAEVRGVDPEWLREFSVDCYRPMERLLAEEDLRFLKNQPGFEPKIARKLRAERRRIFRGYLRDLSRDFGRLHLAARLLSLYAPQDNPDLAKALLRAKIVFLFGMGAAHARLALHTAGIGTVDVRGLIQSLEWMRVQIRDFVPAESAQPAV